MPFKQITSQKPILSSKWKTNKAKKKSKNVNKNKNGANNRTPMEKPMKIAKSEIIELKTEW